MAHEDRITSREGSRSLPFGRRKGLVKTGSLQRTGHEGPIRRREGEGPAHGFPIAPSEMEIAALCLAFGQLEGQETRCEEVFAGREASSAWEGDGGMRLAELVTRRLAPALFDNGWSKQGVDGDHSPAPTFFSRRPRFRSFVAGTGACAAVPQSLSPR
jgi:hypothetical protein